MKCPKCGFTSFDFLENCKKCGHDMQGHKQKFGLRSLIFPTFSNKKAAPEATAETAAESVTTSTTETDFGFDFMSDENDMETSPVAESSPEEPGVSKTVVEEEESPADDFSFNDFDEPAEVTTASEPEPKPEAEFTSAIESSETETGPDDDEGIELSDDFDFSSFDEPADEADLTTASDEADEFAFAAAEDSIETTDPLDELDFDDATEEGDELAGWDDPEEETAEGPDENGDTAEDTKEKSDPFDLRGPAAAEPAPESNNSEVVAALPLEEFSAELEERNAEPQPDPFATIVDSDDESESTGEPFDFIEETIESDLTDEGTVEGVFPGEVDFDLAEDLFEPPSEATVPEPSIAETHAAPGDLEESFEFPSETPAAEPLLDESESLLSFEAVEPKPDLEAPETTLTFAAPAPEPVADEQEPSFSFSEPTTEPDSEEDDLQLGLEGHDPEPGLETPDTIADAEATHPEVAPPLLPVPLGSRLAAGLCDLLILGVVFVLFLIAGQQVLNDPSPGAGGLLPDIATLVDLSGPYFLVLFALSFGYFTLFHFLTGQTPGKMLFQLRVEDLAGEPLSFSQAFLHSVGGLFSMLPAGLGFLAIFFNSSRRGWNDLLAGSQLVPLLEQDGEDGHQS